MNNQQHGVRVWHPISNGTTVYVFSIFIFNHPFIEGRAEIVAPVPDIPNLYKVRFEDERLIHERLVHPGEWQSNPDGKLLELLDHWRLSVTPEIADAFFPSRSSLSRSGGSS